MLQFEGRKGLIGEDADLGCRVTPVDPVETATPKTGTRRALMLAHGDRPLEYRVLRCMSECFDDVFVLGTPGSAQIQFSRFCAGFFHLSGSFEGADGLAAIPQINALCERLSVDLILPSEPVSTRFLAAYGCFLRAPHYPVPPAETFDNLNNKWNFARVCAELGVPHPATRYFTTPAQLAAEAAAGRVVFPVVIKPLSLSGGRGVRVLRRKQDVADAAVYQPLLVQDYIPGDDYCAFFLCRNGEAVISVTYVLVDGGGVLFTAEPEIERHARLIIEHFRFDGVIGFDARRRKTGEIFLIECNPRFWFRMELALLLGLNFADTTFFTRQSAVQPRLGGIRMLSKRRVLARALTPWRLTRHDMALLRYLGRDPVVNLMYRFGKRLKAPALTAPVIEVLSK